MNEPVPEILSAYLDGELSPAEKLRFEQELQTNPELQAELESFKQLQLQIKAIPAIDPAFNFLDKIQEQWEEHSVNTVDNSSTVTVQEHPAGRISNHAHQLTKSYPKTRLHLGKYFSYLAATCAACLVIGFSLKSIHFEKTSVSNLDTTSNYTSPASGVPSEVMKYSEKSNMPVINNPVKTSPLNGEQQVTWEKIDTVTPNYYVTLNNDNLVSLFDNRTNIPQDWSDKYIEGDRDGINNTPPQLPANDNSGGNKGANYKIPVNADNPPAVPVPAQTPAPAPAAEPILVQNQRYVQNIQNRSVIMSNVDNAYHYVLLDTEGFNSVDAKSKEQVNSSSITEFSNIPQSQYYDEKLSSGQAKDSSPDYKSGLSVAPAEKKSLDTMQIPVLAFNELTEQVASQDKLLIIKVDLNDASQNVKQVEEILTNNGIYTVNSIPQELKQMESRLNEKTDPSSVKTGESKSGYNQSKNDSSEKGNRLEKKNAQVQNYSPDQKFDKVQENDVLSQFLRQQHRNSGMKQSFGDSPPTDSADYENANYVVNNGVLLNAHCAQIQNTFNDFISNKNIKSIEVSLGEIPVEDENGLSGKTTLESLKKNSQDNFQLEKATDSPAKPTSPESSAITEKKPAENKLDDHTSDSGNMPSTGIKAEVESTQSPRVDQGNSSKGIQENQMQLKKELSEKESLENFGNQNSYRFGVQTNVNVLCPVNRETEDLRRRGSVGEKNIVDNVNGTKSRPENIIKQKSQDLPQMNEHDYGTNLQRNKESQSDKYSKQQEDNSRYYHAQKDSQKRLTDQNIKVLIIFKRSEEPASMQNGQALPPAPYLPEN